MKRIIWIVLILSLYSCASIKRAKMNRIVEKLNYTQPHHSYSDKPTRRRTWKVVGHAHHFSYKIKRSESYGK
jgi:hypothetical protein